MQRMTGPALVLTGALAMSCTAEPPSQGLDSTDRTPAPTLLIDRTGPERHPRMSPDGRTLAFDAPGDSGSRVFLLDLASGRLDPLTSGPGNDRRPAWSPDGQSIAFVSDRAGSQDLWIQAIDGSDAKRVMEGKGSLFSALDWSPDGDRIALSALDTNGLGNVSYGRSTIVTLEVESGAVAEWTTGGDEWWPAWTADGEWLVYYLGLTDDLEAVHTTTGEIRKVGKGRFVGWRPATAPDGQSIAFVSDVAGSGLFTATGWDSAPRALLLTGDADTPSYLPDESGIVFTMDTTSTRIVRQRPSEAERDTIAIRGFAPRPLADGRIAYLPHGPRGSRIVVWRDGATDTMQVPLDFMADFAFSPDGERLAVAVPSPGDARHDLYVLPANGGPATQLTDAGDVFRLQWCESGFQLAYSSRGDKRNNTIRTLWLVDVDTGDRRSVPTGLESNQWVTHCDHGSDRLTLDLRLNGSGQYVVDRADGLTHLGSGSNGVWSPDGRRLAYLARTDGRTDVFVREPDGTETRVTNDGAVESEVRWTSDGQALVFAIRRPERGIWKLDLANDEP